MLCTPRGTAAPCQLCHLAWNCAAEQLQVQVNSTDLYMCAQWLATSRIPRSWSTSIQLSYMTHRSMISARVQHLHREQQGDGGTERHREVEGN